MRSAPINRRKRAQRARRDAEREDRPARLGPDFPPHGTPIGRIVIELHGQRVEAVLLQAGERCRSHGVVLDGDLLPEPMGLYAAAALVSSRIARAPSSRSDFYDALPVCPPLSD